MAHGSLKDRLCLSIASAAGLLPHHSDSTHALGIELNLIHIERLQTLLPNFGIHLAFGKNKSTGIPTMFVVQIVSWTASDDYLANSAILGPALENLSKSNGCIWYDALGRHSLSASLKFNAFISVHSGLSEEDKTTLYIFIG